MPTCPECGKVLPTAQGVRGHRFFTHGPGRKYSKSPKGVPPPSPVRPDFAERPSVEEPPRPSIGELYKSPQPSSAYAQHAQPAYPQYSPQQQPQPPQSLVQPPVLRVEVAGIPREALLTKEDIKGLVEEAISTRIPAEAPPKPEVDLETRLRQAFEEARKGERGWGKVIAVAKQSQDKIQEIFKERLEKRKRAEESLRPIKEGLGKVGEAIKRVIEKGERVELHPGEPKPQRPEVQQVEKPPAPPTKPQEQVAEATPQVEKPSPPPQQVAEPPKAQPEVSPAQTPESPAEQQAPLSQQPAEPPMSRGDTILMSRRLTCEAATREVEKLLEAEEVKKAEKREKVEEEEPQEKEGEGEEPQGETLEPPEEEPREEPPGELPQRRGIFPLLRRRRLRLFG